MELELYFIEVTGVSVKADPQDNLPLWSGVYLGWELGISRAGDLSLELLRIKVCCFPTTNSVFIIEKRANRIKINKLLSTEVKKGTKMKKTKPVKIYNA